MFLRERATQAEYCDRPDLPPDEVGGSYRQLARFEDRFAGAATSGMLAQSMRSLNRPR